MRKKLHNLWKEGGFWLGLFKAILDFAYCYLSLGTYLTRRFTPAGKGAPAGFIELYQGFWLFAAVLWLFFLNSPVHPAFIAPCFQGIGVFIALYGITEIFIFLLRWIFVASGEVLCVRRSLAGFLINLVEVALYTSIAFSLAGCITSDASPWTTAYKHLSAVLSISLVENVPNKICCEFLALYELAVTGLIISVIIANLVGRITREETYTE